MVARIEEELSQTNDNRVKGLSNGFDQSKPPKNFKDAMRDNNRQKTYDSEYHWHGFYEHQTLKVARPEPGTKVTVLGSTTRTEHKVATRNGELKKYKVLLCVMGNPAAERERTL